MALAAPHGWGAPAPSRRPGGSAAAPTADAAVPLPPPRAFYRRPQAGVPTSAAAGNTLIATATWTGEQQAPQHAGPSAAAATKAALGPSCVADAADRLASGACSAAQIAELAGRAAQLQEPLRGKLAAAVCGAASAAAAGARGTDCLLLVSALAALRVPPPPELRAQLAGRLEAAVWQLTAAALAQAVGQLQRMGHAWGPSAAGRFLERAAADVPGGASVQRRRQQQQGQAVWAVEPSAAPLGPLAVAELLLALRGALQQPSSSSGGVGGSDDTQQHTPLLLVWRHAVACALAEAAEWEFQLAVQQQASNSSMQQSGAQDPLPGVLGLLHAAAALPGHLRSDPGTRQLVRLSLRLANACPLPQLVPLLAAWRALSLLPPRRALVRIARDPLGVLSSAKLAALASCLKDCPPGLRGTRGAAAALSTEVSARLAAGRLAPVPAAQVAAALPHLVRIGWPADCAVAVLAATEAAVPGLAPPQLWEVHRALELLKPRWDALVATASTVWSASPVTNGGSGRQARVNNSSSEGSSNGGSSSSSSSSSAGGSSAASGNGSPDGLMPRPLYPGPAAAGAGSTTQGEAAAIPTGATAVVVVPCTNSAGLSPAAVGAAQLTRLQSAVASALAALPAELLPIDAAPPPLTASPVAKAGAAVQQHEAGTEPAPPERPGPRRQVASVLVRASAVVASPALTPDALAAVCAGLARLLGPSRYRRALVWEAPRRAAARRALEAALWVWLQDASTTGEGPSGRAPRLDGPQLALALRALVLLGADPHAGVAEQVRAAAYAALSVLAPPQLASALRRLAALRLPQRCPAWDALLLRLLVVDFARMAPHEAVPCMHAAVLGLGYRPTPAAAAPLLRRLLTPEATDTLAPQQLLQLAQVVGALRAAGTADCMGHAVTDLLERAALAPLRHAMVRRMESLNGRQLVALGAAVASWGLAPGGRSAVWMRRWLGILLDRAPELTTAEVVQLQVLLADFDLMPDQGAWRYAGAQARLQSALARRSDWRAPLHDALEQRFAATRRASSLLGQMLKRLEAEQQAAGSSTDATSAPPRRGVGSLGMAVPTAPSPREAALARRRKLLFARQRVVWAALRHGVVPLSADWASRCMVVLGPLLPLVNAQVAAALLSAVAAAWPVPVQPGALETLVDRAVACCTFTRGPLLLQLLRGLAGVTSTDGPVAEGDSTSACGPIMVLSSRQRRQLLGAVLQSCGELSPTQQRAALSLLRRADVLPGDGGPVSWLRWVCGVAYDVAGRMSGRQLAAAAGFLMAAAGSGERPVAAMRGNAPPPLRARALLPALRVVLRRLGEAASGSSSHESTVALLDASGSAGPVGSQRLGSLVVALSMLGERGIPQSDWQSALSAGLTTALEEQLTGQQRTHRWWAPHAISPHLPGGLLLQLATALSSGHAAMSHALASEVTERLAALAACGVVPPRPARAAAARMLSARLRVAAAAVARVASSAAAASEAARMAAELAAAADAAAALALVPRGAVRRLRAGGAAAARRAALLQQLAALEAGWQQPGGGGALVPPGALVPVPVAGLLPSFSPTESAALVQVPQSHSQLLRYLYANALPDSATAAVPSLPPPLLLPPPVAVPVLSSILELRFARLVSTVVSTPLALAEGGDGPAAAPSHDYRTPAAV